MEGLKERAAGLKKDIPAVFLALKRKDTPFPAKMTAALAIIYALSPIDLIPDFIPVIGYLDDLILLPVLIALTVKLIPGEIFEECRKEAEGMWQDGKPVKCYYALPFIAVWLLVLYLVLKTIFTHG
ncbi:MAG: YkvA family protein [Eubacteriales bacterium]|nr:YkvA family protein [Eubacteriales bacterium]